MRFHQELLRLHVLRRPGGALLPDLGRRGPQTLLPQEPSRALHHATGPVSPLLRRLSVASQPASQPVSQSGFCPSPSPRRFRCEGSPCLPLENGEGEEEEEEEEEERVFGFSFFSPFALPQSHSLFLSRARAAATLRNGSKLQHHSQLRAHPPMSRTPPRGRRTSERTEPSKPTNQPSETNKRTSKPTLPELSNERTDLATDELFFFFFPAHLLIFTRLKRNTGPGWVHFYLRRNWQGRRAKLWSTTYERYYPPSPCF